MGSRESEDHNRDLNDPDHNPTSSELLEHIGLEISVAKEREPGSTKMEPSWSIEETHAMQFEIQTNPVYNYSEEVIPIEQRKWNDSPAYTHFRGHAFEAEVSKLVMRLVRRNSRTPIGFSIVTKEATKQGSSVARIPEMSHSTFVPFKDTLVGT